MLSIDKVLEMLGYKLDRKLRGIKASFREDRCPTNTGADPWSCTTGLLDSLSHGKFGRLVCKLGTQGALAWPWRLAC